MGGFFGSLAGGAAQGFSGGVDIASRLQQMRQQQHDIMARQALGEMLARGNAGGASQVSPMPGAPSMPSAPPPPMGNISPDPMMGGGDGAPPMPPPAAGMVPDGAPPLPGAPPSPISSAAPAAPAPAGPPGPVGAGGDTLSGGQAPGDDPVQAAQHTIMNIAQQIKAANPNIAPEELFNATSLHIEQMKGVRNDVKDYMQQQIALANIQYKTQASENRLRGVEDTASLNYQGRTEAASTRADAARDVAGTNADARVKSAGISGNARTTAASTAAGARTTAATTAADASKYGADTRAAATADAARQGRAGRENAAGFQSGAKTPKLVGYDPQGNPIYVNGGATGAKPAAAAPAAPAKAGAYKSANDVKAAFQAGKLSQKQATTILQQQFGYQ